MEKAYKNCQSCGMPLKQDPNEGGTNADGSKSEMYCSYCFQNGEFTRPEIDTPEKMQELVMAKLKEMKFPFFVAKFFSYGIPKLARWKK